MVLDNYYHYYRYRLYKVEQEGIMLLVLPLNI